MLIKLEHVSLEIRDPEGWQLVLLPSPPAVMFVPAGDDELDIDYPTVSLTVTWTNLGDEQLRHHADGVMARYVRQGYPVLFGEVLDDRTVLGYEWTDGVMSIVTWFFQGGDTAFELNYAVNPNALDASDIRRQARAWLEQLRVSDGS